MKDNRLIRACGCGEDIQSTALWNQSVAKETFKPIIYAFEESRIFRKKKKTSPLFRCDCHY